MFRIVSNRIMKLHGGNIGVESAGEDCGSTFYIDIPMSHSNTLSSTHSGNNQDTNNRAPDDAAAVSVHQSTQRRRSYLDNLIEGNAGTEFIEYKAKPIVLTHDILPNGDHTCVVQRSSSDEAARGGEQKSNEIPGTIVVHKQPPHRMETSLVLPVPVTTNLVSTAAIKRQTRLLIVDDSTMNRKLLKRALNDLFDICEDAMNGAEAVSKVTSLMKEHGNQFGYNIIITDYSMPVMDGLEEVKQLRAMGYQGKIVGITGNTDTNILNEFEAAGVDMVLIKPFQTDELRELLQVWLAESEYYNTV